MRTRSIAAVLLAAALSSAVATACAPNDEAASDATGTTTAVTEPSELSASALPTASAPPSPTVPLPPPPTPPPSGGAPSVPPDVLDRVRADAAARLGVAAGDVQILSGQGREWEDGALGCPKPGESYIQVITEGYQVIVAANGQTLDYRTSVSGAIKVC